MSWAYYSTGEATRCNPGDSVFTSSILRRAVLTQPSVPRPVHHTSLQQEYCCQGLLVLERGCGGEEGCFQTLGAWNGIPSRSMRTDPSQQSARLQITGFLVRTVAPVYNCECPWSLQARVTGCKRVCWRTRGRISSYVSSW